jgi:hypothetical protein
MTLTQILPYWRRALFSKATASSLIAICLGISLQSSESLADPKPTSAKLGLANYSIEPLAEVGRYSPSSLPKSPLRKGIGTSSFPIKTSSKEAQLYFNQGVNLLHAFWDFEAYRSFAMASELDPQAIMPHWGIVSAIPLATEHDLAAARAASLKRLVQLLPKADDRESRYVRAILSLSSISPFSTEKSYENEMRGLIARYPKDDQARLFLALFLMKGYDTEGHPRPGQGDSEALLQPLLRGDSNNTAAHHYWIHASEYGDLPGRARKSAKKLVELAPEAGHLVHMPGHIDFLLGNFAAAQEHFYKAYLVDRSYLDKEGIAAVDHWNFVHNVDFMVTSEAELGHFRSAKQWGTMLLNIDIPEFRAKSGGRWYLYFEARTSLIRLYMRYGLWEEAVALTKSLLKKNEGTKAAKLYYNILLRFAEVRAASISLVSDRKGSKAEKANQDLEALVYELQKTPIEAGERHHVHLAKSLSKVFLNEARAFLAKDLKSALGWIKAAQEAHDEIGYREPPRYFRPIAEAEIEIRSRLSKDDARLVELFTDSFEKENPWVHTLAARWYRKLGTSSKAVTHYRALLDIWGEADVDLPIITEARNYLQLTKNKPDA